MAQGWVSLFRRTGVASTEIPLQANEIASALSDQLNWQEPTPEAIQILIAATEEGEREYYSGKPD